MEKDGKQDKMLTGNQEVEGRPKAEGLQIVKMNEWVKSKDIYNRT